MENNNKLSRSDRINFQHLRSHGFKFHINHWLLVYWQFTDRRQIRILWNISRKVSNSVVRNKLKRWCREFIRVQLKDIWLVSGLDINVVFKPFEKTFYRNLRSEEMYRELFKFEKKLRDSVRKKS